MSVTYSAHILKLNSTGNGNAPSQIIPETTAQKYIYQKTLKYIFH